MKVIERHRSADLTHGRAERARRDAIRNGCYKVIQ